jgi:NTP pyrophosphatase (non-canonical NTP hydrolase)
MTLDEYSEKARRTEADQNDILNRLFVLGPNAVRLDNAARGLADEVGEISGVVKKYIEYGRPLDVPNALEEAGDVLWRLDQFCRACGFTLQAAMEANVRKLAARYPDKYSDEACANRDKAAEAAALRSSAG